MTLCTYRHPVAATSWKLQCMQKVLALPGVIKVHVDMCQYGMKQKDQEGEGAVKKPTGIMTNSECIAHALEQRCKGEHQHITCCGTGGNSCTRLSHMDV